MSPDAEKKDKPKNSDPKSLEISYSDPQNKELLSLLLSDTFPGEKPDQYLPLFTENPHIEKGMVAFKELFTKAGEKIIELKGLDTNQKISFNDIQKVKEEFKKDIKITQEKAENEDLNFYIEYKDKKELIGTITKDSEAYKMLTWKPSDSAAKNLLELNALIDQESQLENDGVDQLSNLSDQVAGPLSNPDIPSEIYSGGKLNEKYSKAIEGISEETKSKDFETFKGMTSGEIRKKSHIVTKIEGETDNKKIQETTREECHRRIATYTDSVDSEGFFRINYQKVGGHDHEMGIGLGDICTSPDITKLAVFIAEENRYVIAERGFAYNNRPCFKYNGSYLATFTGDKFKILDNEEISDPDEYVSKLNEQVNNRHQFIEHEKKYESFAYSSSINLNANKLNMDSLIANHESLGDKYRPFTDQEIISKLNKYREQDDGKKILEYLNSICSKEFSHIDPAIIKAMIRIEDGYWNPSLQYKGKKNSDATGLGQFLGGTWKDFLVWCENNNMKNSEWAKKWESYPPRREDPYAMMFAIPWLMNETTYKKMCQHDTEVSKFKDLPIHEQAFIYYLGHHEGTPMYALKFMEEMEKNGHTTISEMESAYNENPSKYRALINKGALKRIDKYGIKDYLQVLELSARVGVLAALRKPEIVENIKSKNLEQLKIDAQFSHEDIQTNLDKKRNHKATESLPYRTYQSGNVLNSGAPGYPDGKGEFDVNFAMTQIENLYKSGVKTIVSLDSKEGMSIAIERLKNEKGININHIKFTTNRDILNSNNRKIFTTVANLIKSEEKFLVHCRHGAHRAPFSTCGGFIASGKVKTLKEACDAAGLELGNYKKNYPQMVAQLVEFAAENGLTIEQGYLDWLADRPENIKDKDHLKYGDKAYQHGWPGFENWYTRFTSKYSPDIKKKSLNPENSKVDSQQNTKIEKNPNNIDLSNTKKEEIAITGDSIIFWATNPYTDIKKGKTYNSDINLPAGHFNISSGGNNTRTIYNKFESEVLPNAEKYSVYFTNLGASNMFGTRHMDKNKKLTLNMNEAEIDKTFRMVEERFEKMIQETKENGLHFVIATNPPWGKYIWERTNHNEQTSRLVLNYVNKINNMIMEKAAANNHMTVIPFHQIMLDQNNAGTDGIPSFLPRPYQQFESGDGLHLNVKGRKEYNKIIHETLGFK